VGKGGGSESEEWEREEEVKEDTGNARNEFSNEIFSFHFNGSFFFCHHHPQEKKREVLFGGCVCGGVTAR